MQEIGPKIYVGGDEDCPDGPAARTTDIVVHACKTCHQHTLGYFGSVSPNHPNYLWFEHARDLYLNLIDPRDPAFIPHALVDYALAWMEQKRLLAYSILIHCNRGQSRAPMLALLLMRRAGLIDGDDWDQVEWGFKGQYPRWEPGAGVAAYLKNRWPTFVKEF